MSNYVVYYKMLQLFCDANGEWLQISYLYDDLKKGDPPSPNSYRTLVKYYEADLNLLKGKYNKTKSKALNVWRQLKRVMFALGIYDEADAKVFLSQIQSRREDWDFRQKVRDWARAELDRAALGKEVRIKDLRKICEDYNALLLKREQRKRKT